MKKTVSLEFTGFFVNGYVNVNHWGGGEGCAIMDEVILTPSEIDTFKFTESFIGVESIVNGAEINIYAMYENPEDCTMTTKKFLKDLENCSEDDVIKWLHLEYDDLLHNEAEYQNYLLHMEA